MIVGVLPNFDKRGTADIVEKIGVVLKNCGIKAYMPDNVCAPAFESVSENDIFKISDIIVTVGGDGTIIRYAKLAASENKPVLGINSGRLGFLATLESDKLNLLEKLKTGDYKVEDRMALDVRALDGEREISHFTAINDAVITSGFMSRLIDISAKIKGDTVNYRADGLIVSTPTGSTAYSMSAGGPIIDPENDNITLTPICSHSLNARPIILGPESTVTIKAFSMKHSEIYLSVDGRKAFTVRPGNELEISRSDKRIRLIKLDNRSFYKTISEKFTGC